MYLLTIHRGLLSKLDEICSFLMVAKQNITGWQNQETDNHKPAVYGYEAGI